jgi:hypothetical protein
MSNDFVVHQSILSELNKYRFMFLNDLFEISEYENSKRAFYRAIKLLEKNQWIKLEKGGYQSSESIIVPLSSKFKKAYDDFEYDLNEFSAAHDALCIRVLNELKKKNILNAFILPHQYNEINSNKEYPLDLVSPDAIFTRRNSSVQTYFELELNTKSRKRMYEKFSKLIGSPKVPNVVYVTHNLKVFKSICERVKEFFVEGGNPYGEKFLVIYLKNCSNKKRILEDVVQFNIKDCELLLNAVGVV